MDSSGISFADNQYFHLERVAEGVFAAIAVPGAGAWGNAGIVDLGDQTLIFDTFVTPAAARILRLTAEHLTGRRVGWVVNSHHHMDHVFGNEVFTESEIVATGRTHELIITRGAELIEDAKAHPEALDALREQLEQEPDEQKQRELSQMLGEYRALATVLPRLRLRPPNLTFDGRLVFHGLHRSAELLTYGGGHTDSDAFLYLPNERVAFMGDLVQVGFHPSMRQGDPEQWDRILEQVGHLAPEIVVPGHGPVGNAWDIVRMRQYLTDLQQLTVELLSHGDPAAPAASVPIPTPYTAWEGPSVFTQNIQFLLERAAQAPAADADGAAAAQEADLA